MKAVSKRYCLFLICIVIATLVFSLPASRSFAEWQHFDPNNTNGKLSSSFITGLAIDGDKLWVATDKGLVELNSAVYNPVNPDTFWTEHPEIDSNYAPITAIDIDQAGIIWLGTPKGLVSYNTNEPAPGNRITVHGFASANQSLIEDIKADTTYVWVATDYGVNRYDKSGGWVLYVDDPDRFNSLSARALASEDDDLVWVLPGFPDFLGTYKYIQAGDQWDYITEHNGQTGIMFNSVEVSSSDDIWFGTNGLGLWYFNQAAGQWTQWEQINYGISLSNIWSIGVDRADDRIIVAAESGIAKYDLGFNTWRPISTIGSYELEDQIVTDILVDSDKNQIWFGTESGGLYRLLEGSIIWSNPAKNSRDVPLDLGKVEVIFDKSIDPNTLFIDKVGTSLTVKSSSNPIWPNPGDLTLNWKDPGTFTHLVLTISGILENNTWYTFTFDTGISDYYGDPIDKDSLMFKTIDPPEVVDWEPKDPQDVNPGAPVKIWFNKLMDPNTFFTFPSNITILPPEGSPVGIDANDAIILDPNNRTLLVIQKGFAPGNQYTILVTKNVKDMTGKGMLTDFYLTFTTRLAPQFVNKYLPPTSPFPYFGDQNVPVDTLISVTFSRPMDPDSVESGFIITPDAPGRFEWDLNDTRFVFDPNAPLEFGTTYSITISGQAHDKDYIALEAHPPWSFTTKDVPKIDGNTWPKFVTDVPVDADIVIEFSDPMDPNSLEKAFCLSQSPEFTTCLGGTYDWDPGYKIFTFNPDQDLAYGTKYYVQVDANAMNQDGIYLPLEQEWDFTTTPQPVIEAFYPPHMGPAVSIYINIFVIFDQAMDPKSVKGAFNLVDENIDEDVSGILIWNESLTAFQFAPSQSLANGHTYEVTLYDSAKSASGVHLPEDKTWKFTTVSASQSIEPPKGEDWPKFPVDLNMEGIPSLMDPNTNIAITAIAIDENEALWAGMVSGDTWEGLGLFHFDGKKWTRYTEADGLTNDLINDLVFDSQGNIWIATEYGVTMFDGQAWHQYLPSDPNTFYLENRATMSESDINDLSKINAIDVYSGDGGDLVWIATTGGLGVGRYNDVKGDWEWTATTHPPYLYVLSADSSTGNIWFESGNLFWEEDNPCEAIAGLNANVLLDNITQWPDVWDISNLWVWAPNEVAQKIRYQGEENRAIRDITQDAYKNLWLATDKGLYMIDIDKLKQEEVCDFQRIDPFSTEGGLLSDSIYEVKVNPDDPTKLYVVTELGISIYLITSGDVTNPDNWTRYPFISPVKPMATIEFIPSGGLFVGPDAGLMIIGDTAAPAVKASYPKDGDKDIPVGQQIRITFSELMDANTAEGALALKLQGSTEKIPGKFMWEGKILIFDPDQLLQQGSFYNLTIDKTATDLVGNPLSLSYQAGFETSKSLISKTFPENEQENVQFIDLVIGIDFIRPMDPNTTEDAFCLKEGLNPEDPNVDCVEVDFVWVNDKKLYVYPQELAPGTSYIFTIDDTAEDATGEPMPVAFSVSFTTATEQARFGYMEFIGDGCFIKSLDHKKTSLWERIRHFFVSGSWQGMR